MAERLGIVETIARDMEPHSVLSKDEIRRSIEGLLKHLGARAKAELDRDSGSDESMKSAEEYLVASELVLFVGTQLMALEDIEESDLEDIHRFSDVDLDPKLSN